MIAGFLEAARGHLYRHEASCAALYAAALIGAIALLVPIAGLASGRDRAIALAVLGTAILAAVLVLIGAVVIGAVVPRRRYGEDAELARWVGARRPDLASDLRSSVELAAAQPRVGAPSPVLVEALITATGARIADVRPAALLDRAALRRARRWAAAAAATHAALLLGAPHLIGAGWRNLVSAPAAPFDGAQVSDVPLVGDLEVHLEAPAYSRRPPRTLESASGDLRGLAGTAVTLRARALVPARAVELLIESDAAAGASAARAVVPATLVGDRLTALLTLQRPARYRFAITGPGGARAIESTPRAIEVEIDQPPAVQLLAPAEPLDVTNLRRVELAYVIEDDFGVASAELVWESGKDRGKKPIPLEPGQAASGRAQGKVLWDIAEVQVPSGGQVRYWVEAKDNTTVGPPSVGRSRELHLKVTSPRERHEETLRRHEEVAEKLLGNLGARLLLPAEEAAAAGGSAATGPQVTAAAARDQRDELNRQLREAIVELGAVTSAYAKDPHASDAMRKALGQLRERLDRLAATEPRLVPRGKPALRGAYAGLDAKLVAELEDGVLLLADWLDRERVEGVMDVSDEIAAHQKRLADLLAQYQRSRDPRLLDEIDRELKALDRSYAELEQHRRGMPEDVLDQHVHREAVQAAQGARCLDEVRALTRTGKVREAEAKLESCRNQHARSAAALEGSLASLRGDKFSEEQRRLDEVMNELADIAREQDDLAAEANRIFEDYALKADEVAKDHRRDAARKVGPLIDRLRLRLKELDETGLTPFAKEELDIVERRLLDVESMVSDGDLAEATSMARQAKQSLDTIAGELEAAIEDDPKSKWADATQDALDAVGRARPIAKELIDELGALLPRPDQIMSADDLRALERMRRRQQLNRERARRLADRTRQLGSELPGDTGAELGRELGGAVKHMESADGRARGKDPSGTRESTRSASDALAKARERAQSAARQAQEGAVADEPIRIPGADEYRAPERFREDLLEAMKRKGPQAPAGYDDQIKRYYEELIR